MPQKKSSKAKRSGKCHVCGDTGHYARDCKERKTDSEEVVVQDTTGKCHVCGETGHYARECKDKKSETVKVVVEDTTRKCHLCGYTGHYPRDCKENIRHYDREYKYKTKSGTVRVVLKEILGGFQTTKSKMKKAQGWYLSFGSSAHVCYSRDMFVDYNQMKNHELVLENNDRVDVAGIGTVVLRFTTGKVLPLSNVLHIPAISKCLVSVPKLDVHGYIMSFTGRRCIIKKSCQDIIGNGYGIENGGDVLSTLFQLSLLEEEPVKKVVLDEILGCLASNEHPRFSRGWYLLTKCTVHVCNSRDMFVEYLPFTGHEVVLDNNSPVDVVGVGIVVLQLTTGMALILENVFHIPKITKCCISIGKLIQMGFTVGFRGKSCDIKMDHDIVGNGYVEDGLYRVSVVDEHPSAEYDPMIDHPVNVDNDDHADVVGTVKDTGFDITCGGRECVLKTGDNFVFKMYNDGVLYNSNFVLEAPLPKVVHHETLGLLIGNEHPKLAKAKATVRWWYLFSKCTVHVCNSRDMFVDYQPVTGHEVVLENNCHFDVVGYGTVKLQLTTGHVLTLENVFHMPEIIRCCISMKKLMEMGLGVAFHGEGCYVRKGDEIVGNGFIEDGLFRMGLIGERSGGKQTVLAY